MKNRLKRLFSRVLSELKGTSTGKAREDEPNRDERDEPNKDEQIEPNKAERDESKKTVDDTNKVTDTQTNIPSGRLTVNELITYLEDSKATVRDVNTIKRYVKTYHLGNE